MASKQHNFLVSFISGKLQKNNFKIIYLDGNYVDFSVTKKDIPPKIINHRPDVIGENEDGAFCIGEAKTKYDLYSQRTKNQFLDFLNHVSINKKNRFIIGIYDDSKDELEKILIQLNILKDPQLDIYCVPSIIKPKEKDEEV